MQKPISLEATTSPKLTPMDRLVRYVLLPVVVAIGLHGLIHYAITGDVAVWLELTAMP
ncbi:MAG: hypothetical protein IPH53_10465 [Flavobacteriales bacterium]|nr:hypothetical protein [Flavobacteriales bacterium]MBK7085054.1 hypothetical protein [Flavobacteriales bacterium]MBK7269755.1 hypothetical protein [Flavobacteriales bacterium]MBK7752599.1 hypothetical protein [Flavobacteriales bacterium]MBK9076730.1 hypothetical protein [Flavobacteriales bacterium]